MRPFPTLSLIAVLATSWLSSSTPAHAQVTSEPNAVIFPDPAKFARGFYTEGEVGALVFMGRVADDVGPGFAIGGRFGYDIFRWFAVQAHLLGSTHEMRGDTPVSGQLLQTYQAMLEGKLTLRFRQTSLFAEGGFGAARMSTNVLYVLGLARYRTGFTAGGGGGIDYHSLSRHFSIGLRGGYFWLREIEGSQDLMVTTYLRYTF